jgi:hypothetical protein
MLGLNLEAQFMVCGWPTLKIRQKGLETAS